MTTRQPLALSLSGFQFTYRNNYFDWRLLHGIDVDTVIRLTDVQAVEDCLDTLQRGSFSAERDRLSPANCVQLFRLLQLAIEYCAHLRAAHALLLNCYSTATAAAEGWKVAARRYLDAGAAFLSESLAAGALSRGTLDAADETKSAMEAADRDYNVALDVLEAEDSRARHFRFRKQRTEISWSQLNAADADRLVASLDVGLLEGLLPNLTFGNITSEDDEQLTPHHFGQLIPLAQAALDYVLWQANATGALMEQAMSSLQAACVEIPLLKRAAEELHADITSLLLGGPTPEGLPTPVTHPSGGGIRGGGDSGVRLPGGDGSVDLGGGGGAGRGGSVHMGWGTASTDLGGQFGSGRLSMSPGLTRASSPAHPRPASGAPGGPPQVLRLGPSRFVTPAAATQGALYSGAMAALPGASSGSPARRLSSSFASTALDELVAAGVLAGATSGGGAAALPVLELHSRAAELNHKVDNIEQDLRMERSKTEEMRRILADIRDRLNQRPGGTGLVTPHGLAGPGGGGLSPAESLTFPAAISATYDAAGLHPGLAGYSAFASAPSAAAVVEAGGGWRYGSAAGVNITRPQLSEPAPGPAQVRVFVDEDAIREQERQRAVQVLARHAEKLKQQMLREHQERRLATSIARASLQLQNLGGPAPTGGGSKEGPRHSRQASRDAGGSAQRRSGAPRRSNPGKMGRPASTTHLPRQTQQQQQVDYSSDSEQAAAAALAAAAAAFDTRTAVPAGAAAGGNRPPRPLSRLSGPTIHGSLSDLPAAAAAMYGMAGGGTVVVSGGGSRPATMSGSPGPNGSAAAAAGVGVGGRMGMGYRHRQTATLTASTEDATALPPPSMFASGSVESLAAAGGRPAPPAAAAGGSGAFPQATRVMPQSVRLAASTAFGSISLVGPEKEAAAAAAAAAKANATDGSGNVSKASSFSDRLTPASQMSYTSAPPGGGSGWDAAPAVAASAMGR